MNPPVIVNQNRSSNNYLCTVLNNEKGRELMKSLFDIYKKSDTQRIRRYGRHSNRMMLLNKGLAKSGTTVRFINNEFHTVSTGKVRNVPIEHAERWDVYIGKK